MAKDDILEPIRTRAYFLWNRRGARRGRPGVLDEARREVEREEEQKASLGGST
jgi:hypothetical protein